MSKKTAEATPELQPVLPAPVAEEQPAVAQEKVVAEKKAPERSTGNQALVAAVEAELARKEAASKAPPVEDATDEELADGVEEATAEPEAPAEISRQTIELAKLVGFDEADVAIYEGNEQELLYAIGRESDRILQRERAAKRAEVDRAEAPPQQHQTQADRKRLFENPLRGENMDVDPSIVDALDTVHDSVAQQFESMQNENRELKQRLGRIEGYMSQSLEQQGKQTYESWMAGQPEHVKAILSSEKNQQTHLEDVQLRLSKMKPNGKPINHGDILESALWAMFHKQLNEAGKKQISESIQRRNGTPMGRPVQRQAPQHVDEMEDDKILRGNDRVARMAAVRRAAEQKAKEIGARY